jgi:polygalacturonase
MRAILPLISILVLSVAPLATAQTSPADWARLPGILARIVPPVFPTNDFLVTDFGAVGDGATDCTAAISNAIATCSSGGGGRVVVPVGTFFSGAIHLLNNVNLFLATNATIKFSTNPAAYLPVVFARSAGIEVMNYSPLIYAFQQTNIAITGGGRLDGQASATSWYAWASGAPSPESVDFATLTAEASTNLPVAQRVFGAGHFLRPVFLQPCQCRNVLIQGVTFTNSPMWNLNPVYCTNVTILGITVNEPSSGSPNTDGCDPDSCTDVLIKNCFFNTGDDCIAIKAGRDVDGQRVNIPSQNLVVQGCTFKAGHGGVTIGSETSGGITNVFSEDCVVNSTSQNIALRLKTCPPRGGYIENVYVRNWIVKAAQTGVSMVMNYCSGGTNAPVIRNIDIRDCVFAGLTSRNLDLEGNSTNYPITDVTIANCRFPNVASTWSNTNRITLLNNKGGGF